MLDKSLIISYSTPNYSLSKTYLETLSELNVSSANICHFLDDSMTPDSSCDAFSEFWYLCLIKKFNNLIINIEKNIDSEYKYIISSDCDIWFIEKNKRYWSELENIIDKSDKDIFFMREGSGDDVNCGFFIIKNNKNIITILSFLKEIYQKMITIDKREMHLGEQTLINQEKHRMNFGFIPVEFVAWAGDVFDKNKTLFHHPVCCFSVGQKIDQIEIVKKIIYE
jgi:hypothetical protein